jgi:fibro-slime domain-containing protein
MKNKTSLFLSQKGAAAIIAAVVVASGLMSIVLSTTIIALNNKASMRSFTQSMHNFYNAEIGVQEALLQLRRDPNDLIFDSLNINDAVVNSEFVESESGACDPPLECQFVPDSGWWGEYFNYSVSHPDMQVDPYPGPTPTPLQHDWYDDDYKTHEQIDANVIFDLTDWFPYDGTEWENREGYNHDYHFGQHWRANVVAPSDDDYAYSLASDDDSWVLVNGIVAVNNSGTHASFTKTGDIFLSAGNNTVELYFAERHTVDSGFQFSFDDASLIITPLPEGCGEDLECNSNIQTTASSTQATRKVRYTCNNDIANCFWSELIP